MSFECSLRQKSFGLATLLLFGSSLAAAATFGKVVTIGGPASDIALDEPRGVLYIANYTSARIDVMSLATHTVGRSMSVAAYPGGLAISPDGHYLVITHYAGSGGGALTQPGKDALTVVDLTNNQKRTFGLSSGPVGVAFGIDGRALILTQNEFLLFDPASGVTEVLDSVGNVASQVLPVDQNTFPPQILGGALTATGDGSHIIGVGGITPDKGDGSQMVRFSYNVLNRQLTANQLFTAAPSLGPRVVSASRDGSYYMTGWALIGCGLGFLGDCTAAGPLLAQWPNASGALNVGSVAIRSSKGLIYAQMTQGSGTKSSSKSTLPPSLLVLDADNLTVRDRVQIPENLAGRGIFNASDNVLYAISDSGVMVLPMAELDAAPRVVASAEDLVYRGNFCNTSAITQLVDIVDPGGNATPFQICVAGSNTCSAPGITITPSVGVAPARVKITVDSTLISGMTGTKSFTFEVRSAAAVNMPPPPTRGTLETNYVSNTRSRFRVLINNREPQDQGVFFNVPGELVDLVADPARNRFYVLRQDKNQVQVYDSGSYNLIATLRTGNTPTSMAITFDQNYLLVGNDNSQIANRYDLNTLTPVQPIVFKLGHYPRSIAASAKAILAASRVAGPVHTIDRVDLVSSSASPLSSLGPYKNDIHVATTLAASPNGYAIVAAMPDGRTLLYNANVDAFTASRQDFSSLKGALSASSFGNFMVDHYLLNGSLVPMAAVLDGEASSSGFAFVDQDGVSTAVSKGGAGHIQRLNTRTIESPLPTMMVEAPTLGDTDFPFRRTLAPLADRSGIVALTTSGFTILPWAYDAATAPPVLESIVSAGDFTNPIAPGGLVGIFGHQLSPMTLASTAAPLPTVLADSCLTVNGLVVPMQFVSPAQINAQLPFQVSGTAELILRTPGGVSDVLKATILPTAPSVFRTGNAGPMTGLATVVRKANEQLVTVSNPVHLSDTLTIYLTGMGRTLPEVETGAPAPSNPLSSALIHPTVTLGGTGLPVEFAGLTPGLVGVYQINVGVPSKGVPAGFEIPLTITQGGVSTTVLVRVVD